MLWYLASSCWAAGLPAAAPGAAGPAGPRLPAGAHRRHAAVLLPGLAGRLLPHPGHAG